MTKDYKKRYQAALALLTDIYAADVAAANRPAAAAGATRQGGKAKRVKKRGFELYDETLLGLLTTLSGSLEASWRQKLFTQTLLECPRVPPAALELVCSLCDVAAKPQDVQTGESDREGERYTFFLCGLKVLCVFFCFYQWSRTYVCWFCSQCLHEVAFCPTIS